jgi:hypothetical protein
MAAGLNKRRLPDPQKVVRKSRIGHDNEPFYLSLAGHDNDPSYRSLAGTTLPQSDPSVISKADAIESEEAGVLMV